MQQLLDDAQREVVADVVNAALLASASGKPKWEVKPQVRNLCMHGHPQPLQLHDHIVSEFAAIFLKLVDADAAMLTMATLHSYFLANDTCWFPITFECMRSHNSGCKHAS